MHRKTLVAVVTGALMLAASHVIAQSPPDAASSDTETGLSEPDATADALCKPERIALERERTGRLRSEQRRAQHVTRQTLSEARMGAERFWRSFRDDFITAPFAGFKPLSPTNPAAVSSRDSYAKLCAPMARRDLAFCDALGESTDACRVALAAAGGEQTCATLGALKAPCLAMLGKATLTSKHKACSNPRRSKLCQLIIAARDDASFQACGDARSDDPRKNCLILAMFRGLGGDSGACGKLSRHASKQRSICEAIVHAKPEKCPAAPSEVTSGRQATSKPIRTEIRATFSAAKDGSPSVLMVATAERPAICQVALTATIAGKRRVVWSGIVRLPEYRATRTVVEQSLATAPYARDIEVIKPTRVEAVARCVPRYYW